MTARPVVLTPRQRDVVSGIVAGLSYAEIAAALTRATGRHVARCTVRSHVRTVALKLDVTPDLPPRWQILVWAQAQEYWSRRSKESWANLFRSGRLADDTQAA